MFGDLTAMCSLEVVISGTPFIPTHLELVHSVLLLSGFWFLSSFLFLNNNLVLGESVCVLLCLLVVAN